MTMNLSWLDDFLALAESGHFSRAADERHMTQPAFSRRVRALEVWLGADLFDRTSQPARLTEVGTWFRRVAQDLQAGVSQLPGEARALAKAHSTTLRIAATHALSFTFMPRWLRTLEARTAVGPIQLDSDVQTKCEALVLQGQAQFMLSHGHAAVHGPLDEERYPLLVVGSDRLVAVAAPDEGGGARHRIEALHDSPVHLLGYSAGSGLGRILGELKGSSIARLRATTVLTAHLASVLRTMALDARGLAWLPEILIRDDLAAGRLVAAAPDDWSIELEIRLYRAPKRLGDPAEAFWAAAEATVQM